MNVTLTYFIRFTSTVIVSCGCIVSAKLHFFSLFFFHYFSFRRKTNSSQTFSVDGAMRKYDWDALGQFVVLEYGWECGWVGDTVIRSIGLYCGC